MNTLLLHVTQNPVLISFFSVFWETKDVTGCWNHSEMQMSSICPFTEVGSLSTDFNTVFNTINAADYHCAGMEEFKRKFLFV